MEIIAMRKVLSVVAGVLAAAAALPVLAHHSFAAEFDANKPVKLEGTVTRMEWINPHSWIHIDVRTSSGEVQHWMVEGGAPNALLRRGWTRDTLRAMLLNPAYTADLVWNARTRAKYSRVSAGEVAPARRKARQSKRPQANDPQDFIVVADGHEDHGPGLPGEGRLDARERPRHHIRGRLEAVRRFLGHRRAGRAVRAIARLDEPETERPRFEPEPRPSFSC